MRLLILGTGGMAAQHAKHFAAIDGVTGDAANMAADVDMNFGNLEPKGSGNMSNESSSKPDRPAPRKTEAPVPEPGNSVANAMSNAE